MNFKFWRFLLILGAITSCGVKGPPSPPKESALPSYQDKFIYPDGLPTSSEESKEEAHKTDSATKPETSP